MLIKIFIISLKLINIDCFLQIGRLVFQSNLKKDSSSFFQKNLNSGLDGLAKFDSPNSHGKKSCMSCVF